MRSRFCIAVPARNEAQSLPILIEALARQDLDGPVPVALCVNNSVDDTVAVARAAASRAGAKIQLTIQEASFPAELAHAGSARRAAMDLASEWLGSEGGVLLSTDADCRPPAAWVSANLRHVRADRIVGGRIELDEEEADVPAIIHQLRHRFDRYWQEVRAIEDAIDPCEWDPAPRHGDHTGASLCLTVDLYRRAGGVPLLPSGEDRALVVAATAVGGQLVHPADVWTRASARRTGRAVAGMAADMTRWAASANDETPLVPSFDLWRERALWRQNLRLRLGSDQIAVAEERLPPMSCTMPLPVVPPA